MGWAARASAAKAMRMFTRRIFHRHVDEPGRSAEAAPTSPSPILHDGNTEALRGAITALLNESAQMEQFRREVQFGGKSLNSTALLTALYNAASLHLKTTAFVLDELLHHRTGQHAIEVRRVEGQGKQGNGNSVRKADR